MKVPSPTMGEVAQAHLVALRESRTFAQAKVQYRVLEVLVNTAIQRQTIESGWHLAEMVYGEEPAFDGSEVFYNRAKSALSALRHSLKTYYADLAEPPAVRFTLPERGYDLRIVTNPAESGERETHRPAPLLVSFVRYGMLVTGPLILAFFVGIWWMSMRPSMPASVETRAGFPVLLDRNDREVNDEKWRALLSADEQIDPDAPGHHQRTQEDLAQLHVRAAIVDSALPDCRTAVAVANFVTEDAPDKGRLVLVRADTADPIDSLRLPYFAGPARPDALDVGAEEGVRPVHFHLVDLAAHDLDGDGTRAELLVALSMADLYPSQLLIVDALGNLSVRRNYWLAGHIHEPVVVDLNRDGRAEILIAGMNNDFQRGFVAVLKLDEPDGRTYEAARHKVFEEIADFEENGFVIRLPRTAVSRDARYRTLRTLARIIEPHTLPATLAVEVTDVLPISPLQPGDVHATIWFHLDLERDEIRVSFNPGYDYYLAEMKKLISLGAVDDEWNIVETDRLDEYAHDLATRVECRDGRGPDPGWKPFRPAHLERYLAE